MDTPFERTKLSRRTGKTHVKPPLKWRPIFVVEWSPKRRPGPQNGSLVSDRSTRYESSSMSPQPSKPLPPSRSFPRNLVCFGSGATHGKIAYPDSPKNTRRAVSAPRNGSMRPAETTARSARSALFPRARRRERRRPGGAPEQVSAGGDLSRFRHPVLGVLQPETHELQYVNAGHPPPLLVASKSGARCCAFKPAVRSSGCCRKRYARTSASRWATRN
jgi:Stage II sporulation protein E (SpoIIE)